MRKLYILILKYISFLIQNSNIYTCNILQYLYYWHLIMDIFCRNAYVWKYKHHWILLPCLLQEYWLTSHESLLTASSKTCLSCHARYFLSVKYPMLFWRPFTNCKNVPVVLAWRRTLNTVRRRSEPESGRVERINVSRD
jgi:hypothetical protein